MNINTENNNVPNETASKPKFKITKHHWQGAAAMLIVIAISLSALSFMPGVNLFGASYPFNPNPSRVGL